MFFLPATLEPMQRLVAIHKHLKMKDFVSTEELMKVAADAIGAPHIHRRTFDRDKNTLIDELNAPLIFNRKVKAWKYTEDFDLIPYIPMNSKETDAVIIYKMMLNQLDGSPISKCLNDLLARILKEVDITDSDMEYFEKYYKNIEFEKKPVIKGMKYFLLIHAAIDEKKVISFFYEPYISRKVKKITLTPGKLIEKDGSWFVEGNIVKGETKKSFGLDKISRVKILRGDSLKGNNGGYLKI
ncbi:MAG: hypothetical protein COC01_02785 [Bacteroidetes bacterium]|nr:MAG: hypothetical protein COC01_02785 [Bacteroidota bacterium]